MTDRVRKITVFLDKDYRDDDVEFIKNTIRMIKGVSTVTHDIVTSNYHMARMSLSVDIKDILIDYICDLFDGKIDMNKLKTGR